MRFALMTEPQQGLSYDDLLAICRTAEEAGFESFFRSDHYASFPGGAGKPTTDAWITLAGLARDTRTIGLGVLVSPSTFRLPGTFAKEVTTVDHMSDGRVEVGMGAGWNDLEHRQHGLPFPSLGERFDLLEDLVAIVHGLWTEDDGWSYQGHRFQVEDALFRPRPLQRDGRRHPPIILGGAGKARAAALAARYADEYNASSIDAAGARAIFQRIDRACEEHGRDPSSITRSVMVGVLVGESESDVADRVTELMAVTGQDRAGAQAWLAERRPRWVMGTREQALERIAGFESAGVERLMLQDFLPWDLDHVRFLGSMLGLGGTRTTGSA